MVKLNKLNKLKKPALHNAVYYGQTSRNLERERERSKISRHVMSPVSEFRQPDDRFQHIHMNNEYCRTHYLTIRDTTAV